MGCGQTLFLADGGCITCSYLHCPRRTAAGELLDDNETEHIVQFDPDEFTVRHPLRERLDDTLYDCQLHRDLASLRRPPVPLGRYRARRDGDAWTWEDLGGADVTGHAPEDATAVGEDLTARFGALVLRERKRRRLPLRELSARTGVALNTLSRTERGLGDVLLRSALRIGAELGIHLCDLLDAPPCQGCGNSPPTGFTCHECGRSLP